MDGKAKNADRGIACGGGWEQSRRPTLSIRSVAAVRIVPFSAGVAKWEWGFGFWLSSLPGSSMEDEEAAPLLKQLQDSVDARPDDSDLHFHLVLSLLSPSHLSFWTRFSFCKFASFDLNLGGSCGQCVTGGVLVGEGRRGLWWCRKRASSWAFRDFR